MIRNHGWMAFSGALALVLSVSAWRSEARAAAVSASAAVGSAVGSSDCNECRLCEGSGVDNPHARSGSGGRIGDYDLTHFECATCPNCSNACSPHYACSETDLAALGGLDGLLAAVRRDDHATMAKFLFLSASTSLNRDRQAIQVSGCGGQIAAHVQLTESQYSALNAYMSQLDVRVGLGFRKVLQVATLIGRVAVLRLGGAVSI